MYVTIWYFLVVYVLYEFVQGVILKKKKIVELFLSMSLMVLIGVLEVEE